MGLSIFKQGVSRIGTPILEGILGAILLTIGTLGILIIPYTIYVFIT